MGWLIGRIIVAARGALASRNVQLAAGGAGVAATIADVLNIDMFRREAVRVSPTSDPEALEEAARAVHWMMGLSDQEVIGPRSIENWNYFHYDPIKGRGWWTRRYYSGKSRRASFRRGSGRGYGRGMRAARNIKALSN